METITRRRMVGIAGAAAAANLVALPNSWTRPVIDSVLLPVHAQATVTIPTAPPETDIDVPVAPLPDPPIVPGCEVGELVANVSTLTFTETSVPQEFVIANSTKHVVEGAGVTFVGIMQDMFEVVKPLPEKIAGESSHVVSVQVKSGQGCTLRGGVSNGATLTVTGGSCDQSVSADVLLLVNCDSVANSIRQN